jgi:CheY-like chemotaxis protein/HPt (histidine-containing phosphotransfer) domain-containing protein
MSLFRILVVDDEPDIRKVVERSLARDPDLIVHSCSSGQRALAEAAEWLPHLILLDVMMPVMDGPTTLAHLRGNPSTAAIPVVFLTARAGAKELDRMASLGATGTIAKPFDPKALRAAVRSYLQAVQPCVAAEFQDAAEGVTDDERRRFRTRLRSDALKLEALRASLRSGATAASDLDELQTVAHKLVGAAGIFGFEHVSHSASALEQSIVEIRRGRGTPENVESDVGALVDVIERGGA